MTDPIHINTSRFNAFDQQQIANILKLYSSSTNHENSIHQVDGRQVAQLLSEVGSDSETIQASLLVGLRLRECITQDIIKNNYSPTIGILTEGLYKLVSVPVCQRKTHSRHPIQAEHVRRMLLAMSEDVRAVLACLAWRVEQLKEAKQSPSWLRHCLAEETMEIHAPLANRLGVGQLKWLLEDLSFRYAEPQEYKRLAKKLEQKRQEREKLIDEFMVQVKTLLKQNNLTAEVYGRPKHLYSIARKMRRKQLELEDLYDLLAVRIIVETISECYLALGIIHEHFTPVPKEFDDYIANPKENGYRSLHTAVIGAYGRPIEVQIRTQGMHEYAEHGIAAHWRYKEGSAHDHSLDKMINSLRSLLDQKINDEELLESFHTDLFGDRVFVLTPKGDVIELPKGATPLDFAYAVHTEVGHRCRGAKVDGRIVPLQYLLRSGQQVEVLLAKEGNPSRDWLNPNTGYLYSTSARAKVRQWFSKQDRDKNLAAGKEILEKEAQRFGLEKLDMDFLIKRFHVQTDDELLLAIGRSDIRPAQLSTALQILSQPDTPIDVPVSRKGTSKHKKIPGAITVQGVGNLLVQFAQCCHPVPGDRIIGYITQHDGITIHRIECSNILNLPVEQRHRLIEVRWEQAKDAYPVHLHVEAFDRQGLLRDITATLSNEKVNVLTANTRTNKSDQSVVMDLEIEIIDLKQLTRILDRIGQLPHVIKAIRNK